MKDSIKFINAWPRLETELDLWAESGKKASFWWRDDDAVSETSKLNLLNNISQTFDIPVSIAVIPALIESSLPKFLLQHNHFSVLQHGFSHSSYAEKGAKKIELGGERSDTSIVTELFDGFQRMKKSFPDQFIPVLVPPWNRIDPRVFQSLREIGFTGISVSGARDVEYPVANLLQINTHVDPINWRHGREFIGAELAITIIQKHLYLRRTKDKYSDEPTGLLTHHLVHNESIWSFCRSLFKHLNQHSAVHWKDARQMWPLI